MPIVKQSKKERPKSTEKNKARPKREVTPDKVATPPESAGQGAPTNNSTVTEEKPGPQMSATSHSVSNIKIGASVSNNLDSLQIREENLLKTHISTVDVSGKSKIKMTIRKKKPSNIGGDEDGDGQRSRSNVYVARPAHPERGESIVTLSHAASAEDVHFGPRLDRHGRAISYSILGSLDDFNTMAEKKQQQKLKSPIKPDSVEVESSIAQDVSADRTDTIEPVEVPISKRINEEAALDNWKRHMSYRKNQQEYLSKILDTNPAMLVMNQSEGYRKYQEEREAIDLAIPQVIHGTGYPFGSEFWRQPDRIGNEETGISLTLGKTQRGDKRQLEHIDKHSLIKEEMGINFRSYSTVHYPWDKSLYLQSRKKELEKVMKEADPHKPDATGLAVVGKHKLWEDINEQSDINTSLYNDESLSEPESDIIDPLKNHADCVPQPVLGPCLVVAGQLVRWDGGNYASDSDIAMMARVLFETYAGKVTTSTLDIENLGTSTVYFSWTSLPSDKSLDSVLYGKAQRFYFNTGVDVVMPGQKIKFPFTFKSSNPGIFTETWRMNTKPTLCGGSAIKVVLRGVALEEDINKEKRSQIEATLRRNQALCTVSQIIDDILDDVKSPPRPLSPVDAHVTNEELFERENPGFYYHPDGIYDLKLLWYQIHQPIPQEYLEPSEDVKAEKGSKQEKSSKSEKYDKTSKSDKQDRQDKGFRSGKSDPTDRQTDYIEAPEPDIPWDWSLATMEDTILSLEDENWQNDCLLRMNNAINALSFPVLIPLKQQLYTVGYSLFVDLIDSIASYGVMLRSILGLPEKESIEEEEITPTTTTKKKTTPMDTGRSDSSKKSDSRSKKPAKSKDDKDSDTLRPSSRTKKSKHKDRGKSSTVSSQDNIDQTRTSTPVEKTDPTIESKYKEKLYSQVYNMLESTIDRMIYLFDDIKARELSATSDDA